MADPQSILKYFTVGLVESSNILIQPSCATKGVNDIKTTLVSPASEIQQVKKKRSVTTICFGVTRRKRFPQIEDQSEEVNGYTLLKTERQSESQDPLYLSDLEQNMEILDCHLDDVDLVFKRTEDRRGKHWVTKVSEGRPPQPWKHSKEWALRRKEKEIEFGEFLRSRGLTFELPWRHRGEFPSTGNTLKVLLIDLLISSFKGEVFLSRESGTRGFFGIVRIQVPSEYRSAFDAGAICSLDSLRRSDGHPSKHLRKSMAKIWETAGFREHVLPGGALLYEYDASVCEKQKHQQRCKRRKQ